MTVNTVSHFCCESERFVGIGWEANARRKKNVSFPCRILRSGKTCQQWNTLFFHHIHTVWVSRRLFPATKLVEQFTETSDASPNNDQYIMAY